MQSGTTGINTTRVYNPIKQAQDHDLYGKFVRRWLPYMRPVPDTWLFEPWLMPEQQKNKLDLSCHIVQPLVELASATRDSKQRLHARRKQPETIDGKKVVIDKHASRKSMLSHKKPITTKRLNESQLGFDF
jgi:deoxyribodipyrimidine photo-lyase